MNIARRPPLGLKQPKAKARPDYLAAVRELPCIICTSFGEPQTTPTAAHHVIHGRYGQRRTPDVQAIPLCHFHHQGSAGSTRSRRNGGPGMASMLSMSR